jgi:hypothetical protein
MASLTLFQPFCHNTYVWSSDVIGYRSTQSGAGLQRASQNRKRGRHTLQVVHPVRTLGLLALFLRAFVGGAMLEKEVAAWMSWREGWPA